ncbi:hypothetical protein [Diaphorobacter caeni]|nr:hypothetical protein [Diaphorobacter caeni]MBF5007081.1 hypothetical protein [Diaphorobacter caeni]
MARPLTSARPYLHNEGTRAPRRILQAMPVALCSNTRKAGLAPLCVTA